MSTEKSYLTSYPNSKNWSLQKMGVLLLSFYPLPIHANNDDTLLQFSMQIGSIMYVLFIVYIFARNSKIRIQLFVVYLSLTASAYFFTSNKKLELSIVLTVFICSIVPLLSTIVLVILDRIWRKT